MRVTTFGTTQVYLQDLNNIMQKYQGLEQQLSTGRKLNQPSDNPVGFEADISIQHALTQTGQWGNNAAAALSDMQNSDSTMATLQNILGSIRTELVQASNGTNTPADVGQIATRVAQQVKEVAQVAGTNDGQQYIFGGSNGKIQPITLNASGQLVWNLAAQGGTPTKSTTIGANVSLAVSVDGTQLFDLPPTTGVPGLVDNLNQIVTDMQSAGTATSGAAFQSSLQSIQTDLNNLDANMNNVSALRGDLGGRMNRAQSAVNQLDQATTQLSAQKSNVEDANLAQVMTQLTTQQTVYQAAIAAGQQLVLPTLADVLK